MALRGFVYKRAINLIGLDDPLVNNVMSATSAVYRGLANILIAVLVYSMIMSCLKALST